MPPPAQTTPLADTITTQDTDPPPTSIGGWGWPGYGDDGGGSDGDD